MRLLSSEAACVLTCLMAASGVPVEPDKDGGGRAGWLRGEKSELSGGTARGSGVRS